MTITEQLENIILKYKLDKAYPRFRNYVKCKKITKELFSKYTEKDKILLLSSEADSPTLILQEIEVYCDKEVQVIDVLDLKKLDSINFNIYSDVILLSNDFYKEISYELSLRKIRHKCLYDCFAKNGLFLDYNYYNISGGKFKPLHKIEAGTDYSFKSMNACYELFNCYKKYTLQNERELKQFYLQKVIFLSLYMRDFVSMEIHINAYISKKYNNYKLYTEAFKAIEKLLNNIKLKLSARKGDYLALLNDSLDYGNKRNTPFLNSISKKSLHFENAYTTVSFTRPAFKSLMTGKFAVDDRSFEISFKNSLVENLCKEHGLSFKYSGFLDFGQNTNSTSAYIMPASMRYWLAIEYLLSSNQMKFVFIHALAETHPPFCANNLIKLKDMFVTRVARSLVNSFTNPKQVELSIAYADKQLQWYNELFPQNSTKIYMNDHGFHFPQFFARLDINAPWIKPRKVKGIFCYVDFHKLVNMLLEKKLDCLDDLFSDYVKIQDIPVYNDARIKRLIPSLPPSLFGYRGVITKQAIYMKYGDGYEFYRNKKISGHRFSKEELKHLSNLAGNYFLDCNKEEMLKYSRRSYEVLAKYNKRNGLYEKKKSHVFTNLLKNVPKDNIVAIRSGGNAAVELLLKLGVEQQNRISFIIDKNPKCSGAYFGIPVISPQTAKRTKIDVIIAPQNEKDIGQEVRKELSDFSKKGIVINIYSFLANKGIVCAKNFWERELIKLNGLYEKKKFNIFTNLLKNIPKDNIVAIRSGGNAAVELLLKLGVEQQNRISFIIDKNPKCSGAYFGIPVISPQIAKRTKIDVIITPQNEKDIGQEVKKELSDFSKKGIVIDIYSFLANKGIVCAKNFWEREPIEDDFF